MNKDFFKGLAVGVGIAGLAAVAATAAVKALKGCCCGDCDDDFEYAAGSARRTPAPKASRSAPSAVPAWPPPPADW